MSLEKFSLIAIAADEVWISFTLFFSSLIKHTENGVMT
jgi:hypothetical protein